jgi:hypothetical protein
MTSDKRLQLQNWISDGETEAMAWSLADTKRVTNQLEREIYSITLNTQTRLKKKFSVHSIKCEDWWETISNQVLRTTIDQRIIHFEYPKMQLVSHLWLSIRPMGSSVKFTTDISGRLHISDVKEAYRCSNHVNYIWQMFKHNDQCTGVNYMAETMSYLVL